MDLDEAEKQDLLQRLDRLEWKTLSDSHPRVHVLCIDFIFENYELLERSLHGVDRECRPS